MANRHRGEISAVLDGEPMTLCLTLGALAELEDAFGDEDMIRLAERFSTGRISARDAIRVLGAGLRGAGHNISDEKVGRMRVERGAAGFVAIVARLLEATFADASEDAVPRPGGEPRALASEGAEATARPFPGATSSPSASPP